VPLPSRPEAVRSQPAQRKPAAGAGFGPPGAGSGEPVRATSRPALTRPPARAEPSWPRVLATTIELWLRRRRLRWTHAFIGVLVIGLAAGLAVTAARLTSSGPARSPAAGRPPGPAAARGQAADWVAAQVSHGVLVSCDPAMCLALQRHGFPASNLVMVRPGAANPPGASLIVVTAAIRTELGRRLASWSAPVVLASFGAGSVRTEIRAAGPPGPGSYLSRFRADIATRRSIGTELLHNRAVEADPPARQQLSEGRVDSRLIAMIDIMTALHPVHLVSFGDPSPGASPGVPLRSVLLYGVVHGTTPGTAFLDSLRALLLTQHPSYHPAGIAIVRLATGQDALRIWFAAPSPLGLLDASQPLVKISSP
jgi:hypothetical protein